VQLCVALVKYKTKFGRTKQGTCSLYIDQLQPGSQVLPIAVESIMSNSTGGAMDQGQQSDASESRLCDCPDHYGGSWYWSSTFQGDGAGKSGKTQQSLICRSF